MANLQSLCDSDQSTLVADHQEVMGAPGQVPGHDLVRVHNSPRVVALGKGYGERDAAPES
ncbi:hypothetical protein GCM10007231_33640 [Nocardioides daphniae]|uniref:Uncharacterized protein n=1 Tax=Nocardioides daphniae TaxID=402297 RepID=A0ABQ1QKF3_9ACTN|nr:hypothetical protein GCM10007231_33640 [Nocardioides daphniae]